MNPLARAALWYARHGWSVLPLEPRGKRPLAQALPNGRWQSFQRAAPSVEQVEAWWRRWPGANVGIVTGAVSGLVVLDVDGEQGEESLRDLTTAHGPLPDTVEALTGGGGRHILFAHPGGMVRNGVGIAPGLDVRADGGYIVAPPSVHPSGRRYMWEASSRPDETRLAPVPDWLLEALQPKPAGLSRSTDEWRCLVAEGVTEGERNNAVASLAGHLLRRYVDPWVTLALIQAWNEARCRPPLPADEVARTVDSVARLEAARRRRGERRHG